MSKPEPLVVSGERVTDTMLHHDSAPVTRRRRLLGLTAPALVLAACGGSDDTELMRPLPEGREVAPAGDQPDAAPATPAVMVVGQVYAPEDYFTYVGVFADVPEGEVSFDGFREFGNANAYTSGGYIFVEQDGIVQRFSVDEDLQIVDGPRFSWQEFGVAGINTTSTVFACARAERRHRLEPRRDGPHRHAPVRDAGAPRRHGHLRL
jgi:hypothetical protein